MPANVAVTLTTPCSVQALLDFVNDNLDDSTGVEIAVAGTVTSTSTTVVITPGHAAPVIPG